jgi:hypothetical protein
VRSPLQERTTQAKAAHKVSFENYGSAPPVPFRSLERGKNFKNSYVRLNKSKQNASGLGSIPILWT